MPATAANTHEHNMPATTANTHEHNMPAPAANKLPQTMHDFASAPARPPTRASSPTPPDEDIALEANTTLLAKTVDQHSWPASRPTSAASRRASRATYRHTHSAPGSVSVSRGEPFVGNTLRRRPATASTGMLTGGFSSSLPSRNGSPAWSRPTSAFGKSTATRDRCPRLYEGKGVAQPTLLGTMEPGLYDVRGLSKTGTPRDQLAKGTPTMGGARRFNRARCYEGKENAQSLHRGQFGGQFYDVRCSKTGTPRLQPKGGTPKIGGGARFNRERCYEGKERLATLRGREGASVIDPPRCSNRGSPLWQRPTSAFGATTQPRLVRPPMAAPAA
jgi:hypothetical protein